MLNNRVGQVKRAVEALRIDPNARFTQARKRQHRDLCAVHLAAFRGHIELLHYLISAGSDVNRVTATLRRQPLHYAALRHQVRHKRHCATQHLICVASLLYEFYFTGLPVMQISESV